MWICHSDLVINSIDAVSANVCVKYASDALDFIWCIYTTCRKMKRIVVKVFIHEFVSWWNMLETLKLEYAHCTLTHTLEFAGARICCALHEKKLLCLHISKIHITSKRQMPSTWWFYIQLKYPMKHVSWCLHRSDFNTRFTIIM